MTKYRAPTNRNQSGPAQAQVRVELRAAIVEACRARGDSDEHRAQCLKDMAQEEPGSLPWWLGYFKGEAARYRFDRARFEQTLSA